MIKNCIKRQGSFFLLLDYDPTTEEDQYYDTPLTPTTPHFPLDLLGLGNELPQPSSIYCQESANWSDQDEHAKPEETTCTQVEDSPRFPHKKLTIGLLKNGNRINNPLLLKSKNKKIIIPLFTWKTQTKISNPNPKSVSNLRQQRRNVIEERRFLKQKT